MPQPVVRDTFQEQMRRDRRECGANRPERREGNGGIGRLDIKPFQGICVTPLG
jgi:hypothetical protein